MSEHGDTPNASGHSAAGADRLRPLGIVRRPEVIALAGLFLVAGRLGVVAGRPGWVYVVVVGAAAIASELAFAAFGTRPRGARLWAQVAVLMAAMSAAVYATGWGFALGMADGGVQVQAVPVGLAIEVLATTLADLASHLGGSGGNTVAGRRDALLATLACHTSVRAGQPLALVEQQALIDQLSSCEGPRTCPHGRPTVIVITRNQLERQFGRLGA